MPESTSTAITFNGSRCEGEDHDAFHLSNDLAPAQFPHPGLPAGAVWRYCKTERQPYDLAVMAVLLRTHQRAPTAFTISSNGTWDREWEHARRLVRDLFKTECSADPLALGVLPY